MITLLDIKKTVNDILLKEMPNIKIYSNDIKEGFSRPCFFTQVVQLNRENENINYISNKVMIVINYFSENKTEIENLQMDNDLKNAFGMNLKVHERSFLLKNITSEIVDEVLQFKFNIEYLEDRNIIDNYEKMKEVKIKYSGGNKWDYQK